MKKELSKGTQKFIWHMVAFAAVFILALVAISKFAPDPVRTASPNEPQQTVSSQQEDTTQGTDFDSVKARVDAANNTTGREVRSLFFGEGETIAQRQAESRLFFSNMKNLLFCVLLVVVIVLLIKKGFNLNKFKRMLTEDEENETKSEAPKESPKPEPERCAEMSKKVSESVPSDASSKEEPPLEEEPGFDEGTPSEDEKEVAENCKF